MSSSVRTFFALVVGFLLRYLLITCSYRRSIADRVEISTPVNSWKRVVEGVTLLDLGISPYDGDTFHEVPIFLIFYHRLYTYLKPWLPVIFAAIDVLTGLILSITSTVQLQRIREWEMNRLTKLKLEDSKKLAIPMNSVSELSYRVLLIYLFLPYSSLSCAAMTTSVFTNFITALIMLSASLGQRIIATSLTALLAYHSLYAIAFILPVIMVAEKVNHKVNSLEEFSYTSSRVIFSMTWTILSFLALVVGLLQLSYLLMGSSSFISSTYWFLLTVPDFTPNIGLFWYFFTEMFDQFRDFFLWTFQINSFIYFLPLSLITRENPCFLFIITSILQSLFKPYPSISDAAFYIALMPQWSHLFPFFRQGIFVSAVFVSCSVLAPIMWHMWIILGTANSNYFFGVTLAYNAGQIFLVTDLLFAYMKRNYFLESGMKLDEKGKPIGLELVSD